MPPNIHVWAFENIIFESSEMRSIRKPTVFDASKTSFLTACKNRRFLLFAELSSATVTNFQFVTCYKIRDFVNIYSNLFKRLETNIKSKLKEVSY